MSTGFKYLAVSPVKDEERFVETTLQAMIRQSLRPTLWLIVDDGSRDRTPQILERYAREHPWIQVHRVERDAARRLGWAEIRAFTAGYERVKSTSFDLVVKLDCDLDLPQDYFERLVRKFEENPKLGIGSGVYVEKHGNISRVIPFPPYHAAGGSKMVRRECFEQIGGFPQDAGWDTADEVRAWAYGWETTHFPELQFHHLRVEGSAQGSTSTNLLHGRVCYVTGASKLWVLLKGLHRMFQGKPFLWGGLTMFAGYFGAWASGAQRLVTDSQARNYRKILNQRILKGLKIKDLASS